MMSRRRPGHLFALLLLLYVTADLMDPSTPGAFSFEKDAFFVDGVVQFKSDASTPFTPLTPMMPSAGTAGTAVASDEHAAAKVCAAARLLPPQPLRWKNQKHDGFASFASTSPPDSAPASLAS